MFFKGPMNGLRGGALHKVTVSLEFATNAPSGCFGVGGSPGESVWIKAGVTAVEPLPIRDGSYLAYEHRHRTSIRQRCTGGGARQHCQLQKLRAAASVGAQDLAGLDAVTDLDTADGRVWLLFGTDSGFESRTEIYFTESIGHLHAMDAGERVICAENYVTARAVRTREEIPPFVQCAYEFVLQAGFEEARRAFHEDERWRSGPIYVFIDEIRRILTCLERSSIPPILQGKGPLGPVDRCLR